MRRHVWNYWGTCFTINNTIFSYTWRYTLPTKSLDPPVIFHLNSQKIYETHLQINFFFFQTEAAMNALQFLMEIIEKLVNDPGQFENYQKELTALYIDHADNQHVVSNAIELFFNNVSNSFYNV